MISQFPDEFEARGSERSKVRQCWRQLIGHKFEEKGTNKLESLEAQNRLGDPAASDGMTDRILGL